MRVLKGFETICNERFMKLEVPQEIVEVGATLGVVPLGAGVMGPAGGVWAVGRVAAENRRGAGNGHPGHNLRGEDADSSFHNLG